MATAITRKKNKLELTRKQLESFAKIIGTVSDSMVLNIEEDKIQTEVIDMGYISMMEFTWPADAFQTYEVKNPTKVEIVNLKDLIVAGKTAGMRDTVSITIKEHFGVSTNNSEAKINANIGTDELNNRKGPHNPIETLKGCDFAEAKGIRIDFLKTALDGTSRISDLTDFSLIDNKLGITASTSSEDWKYHTNPEQCNVTKNYEKHKEMCYQSSYLKTLFTQLNSAKALDISLKFFTPDGKSGPLMITGNLPDGAHFTYWLAPRVNDGV